jgi:MraZ protein
VLFVGNSEHSIDAKQRLAVPAKFRSGWDTQKDGTAWYCIPWPTGHLRLYTEGQFKEMAEAEQSTLTPAEEEAGLDTTLYGLAERLEMDSTGRITIPKTHMEMTGIGGEVVVVGARARLEIHDKPRWTAALHDRFKQLPDLINKINEKRSVSRA